jgi:hypothetical protein
MAPTKYQKIKERKLTVTKAIGLGESRYTFINRHNFRSSSSDQESLIKLGLRSDVMVRCKIALGGFSNILDSWDAKDTVMGCCGPAAAIVLNKTRSCSSVQGTLRMLAAE